MSAVSKDLIAKLKTLSEKDSLIAIALAEKLRTEETIENKKLEVEKIEKTFRSIETKYLEKKNLINKEEKYLKEEQSKLVDRRKALKSLNNYKLQEAAEREIEHASKQLSGQEESLIMIMEEVSELEKQSNQLKDSLDKINSEYSELEKDSDETLTNVETRVGDYRKEKEATESDIDSETIELYTKLSSRYPKNAIVALNGTSCGGCFLELGPQIVVEVGKCESLVTCRACGRILYLDQ